MITVLMGEKDKNDKEKCLQKRQTFTMYFGTLTIVLIFRFCGRYRRKGRAGRMV